MIVTILVAGFFVLAIGSFCIKEKCYEDAVKKNTSYRPLLDDSFTADRVV